MEYIAQRLANVTARIREFEKKYHRPPHSVHLLAASKKQSLAKLEAAYIAGQHVFGENYVQEALLKMPTLPNAEWHFIGTIQSNKTREIATHFQWVDSVADEKMARRLSEQRPSHFPPLQICIEVNISKAATKTGVMLDDLSELARYCASLPQLVLRGLMVMPTPAHLPEEQREEFHNVFVLWEALRQSHLTIDTLSMGTTDDFEAAIAEGSTLVRLGTAIFGQRDPS